MLDNFTHVSTLKKADTMLALISPCVLQSSSPLACQHSYALWNGANVKMSLRGRKLPVYWLLVFTICCTVVHFHMSF